MTSQLGSSRLASYVSFWLEYALQQGYEPKVTQPPRAQVSKAAAAEISSSSDSDDGGKSKCKGFKIARYAERLREELAGWHRHGHQTKDASWDDEKEGEFKKKQTKIKILIQGSLSMRLAKQMVVKPTGTEMWRERMDIYEGKPNPAMMAQSVSLAMRTTQDESAGLADLGSPVNDLQMVDRMLRSLPTLPCYNELRRKVLFSSILGKYTPDLVRELILTAELRSKDWENNAFVNKQTSKTQVKQSGVQRSNKKNAASVDKKPNKSGGGGCFNCGGTEHYKRNCPGLEEKSSGRTHTPNMLGTTLSLNHCNQQCVRSTSQHCRTWKIATGTHHSGFADGVDAKSEGFGTIMLAATVDEEMVFMLVEDVLYVPSASCNLFSPGLALDQGFTKTWDSKARIFGMTKENTEVIRTEFENSLRTFNAQNVGNSFANKKNIAVKKKVFANFAVTDGVEDIDVWHERLGHTCPEYIRLMVDRGMAKGVMLKRRGKIDYVDCHFGKQRRKTFRKKLDRPIEKRAMNDRMGFLLGYREDVVGCHVYLPTEHNKGFASDVEINEAIRYKDRVECGYRTKVNRWLQTFNEFIEKGGFDDFANGDDDNLANSDDDDSSQQVVCDVDSECGEVTNVEMENVELVDGSNDYDPTNMWQGRLRSRQPQSSVPGNSLQNVQSEHENSQSENTADRQLWDDILRNSSLPDSEPDINPIAESNKIEDVDASVSSVDAVGNDHIGDDDDQSDQSDHSEQNDNKDDIESETAPSVAHCTELATVVDPDSSGGIDYDSLFDPADEREAIEERTGELVPATNHEVVILPEQSIGHRRPRDVDVRRTRERKRNKVDVKRVKESPSRRPGLREHDERRPPQRYDDYVVYSAFRAMHTDRRGDGGIRASDVKIPRTRREALRSKYGPLWQAAMDKQVAALRAKGVLKMIPKSELPEGQRLLKTMWVYDLKMDYLGYVVEFRARIVGRGDKQRPGLDYTETFSPAALMATFRMFLADLDGYPCELDGMAYMVNKALYGLKQSGTEWNTEVNAWFISYGFKQCNTEPCLYYYGRDGEFVIVLLYVDDILCATKNEEFKKKMCNQLNEDYGLKDQGLLDTYLGIEVEQNSNSIKVHQTKYCEQILERFEFSEAHPSRIPMETKLRLTVNDTNTAARLEPNPT
ncbi:hypothetical protein ON010_g13293 [Phytophthora cinnamomi]|nr:hypothetical protein ON010_g13293 [Phytophthora cinnamomi]